MKAPRLNEQLCYALYAASNFMTALYRPELDKVGITYPQYVVMMALWEKDSVSITDLASVTGLTNATLTPLLRRLENKMLIKMERVKGNERQKSIALTETGTALSGECGKISDRVFKQTGLSKQEAKTLMEMCHTMVDAN